MQGNQLLLNFFPSPLTVCSPQPQSWSLHMRWAELSQVWGHLEMSKCSQTWLNLVKVKQPWSVLQQPPGPCSSVLYFTLKHLCGPGLLAALLWFAEQLAENHWLFSLPCPKGLDQSHCNWINPISWHKSQWIWKKYPWYFWMCRNTILTSLVFRERLQVQFRFKATPQLNYSPATSEKEI